jgi:uncharacterized membrane protein
MKFMHSGKLSAKKLDENKKKSQKKRRMPGHAEAERPDVTKPTIYNLFWATVVFSFLGYLTEMAYQYHLTGKHESRKGVIYGPISEIYGIGADVGILLTHRFYNRNIICLFLFFIMFGGAYEYFASLFEEKVFKTSAWNYEEELLNINGRTNLKFSIYWALFGLAAVRYVYPCMCLELHKLPRKTNQIITAAAFFLIATDAFLSTFAMVRYRERNENIPATTDFQRFLDNAYPDSLMKKIYPDMKFI